MPLKLAPKKGLEGCNVQQFLKTKCDNRRYLEMVDPKYPGISYEVKEKLGLHAALEVLKLEACVDSDGSENREKDTEKKWEGRSEILEGGIQAGLLDFLKSSEGHSPINPWLFTFPQAM